jgi:hypothetical protein
LARIPGSIGRFHAKGISNRPLRDCNWFFAPDDSFASIGTGYACREYGKCPAFFEARL